MSGDSRVYGVQRLRKGSRVREELRDLRLFLSINLRFIGQLVEMEAFVLKVAKDES